MGTKLEVEAEGNLICLSRFPEQRESTEVSEYSRNGSKAWKEYISDKRILLFLLAIVVCFFLIIIVQAGTSFSHHQAQGITQETVRNLQAQINLLTQKIDQEMQYAEFAKEAMASLQNQIGNLSNTVKHGMQDLAEAERTAASVNEATDILQEKITNLTEAFLQQTNHTESINERTSALQTELISWRQTLLQEMNKTARNSKTNFLHGLTYTITSVAHGGRLHVASNRIGDGINIITATIINDDSQRFLFRVNGNGWRLTSMASERGRKVLDQDVPSGKLQQWQNFPNNNNQEWNFKPVTNNNHNDGSVYQIFSVSNWKAITSYGIGNNVMCENQQESNTRQLWKIERS